jgi:hypothetical protein
MAVTVPSRDRALAEILTELRSAVTPVLGYLELLAEDAPERPSDEHLRWIGIVEERLASLEAASREVAVACAKLRALSPDRAELELAALAPPDGTAS